VRVGIETINVAKYRGSGNLTIDSGSQIQCGHYSAQANRRFVYLGGLLSDSTEVRKGVSREAVVARNLEPLRRSKDIETCLKKVILYRTLVLAMLMQ
jgi:hypothetical protein